MPSPYYPFMSLRQNHGSNTKQKFNMATPTIKLLKLLLLALLSVLNIVKRFFLFYYEKKTIKNKLSNFDPKSRVNSFTKIQYGNPHHRTLKKALFDPFSSIYKPSSKVFSYSI